MLSEIVFIAGAGTSALQTDWGTQGSVNMQIPLVIVGAQYKQVELRLAYGHESSTDTSFNGLYQEEAKVSDYTNISLLRNFSITPKVDLEVGIGYASYMDHGKPKGASKGWKERDDDWGYRLGITYKITETTKVNLSFSDIRKSNKHWDRMQGYSDTHAVSLMITKEF